MSTASRNLFGKQASYITTKDPVKVEPTSETFYTGNRSNFRGRDRGSIFRGRFNYRAVQVQGIIDLREVEAPGQFQTLEIV